MPKYTYFARDISGKRTNGFLDADNENDLYSQLRARDLYLIKSKETTAKARYKKMNSKDLSDFCRKLGTMLASGVPLVKSMNIILQGEVNKRVRPSIEDLTSSLKEGIAMSDAMQRQGKVFPELLINMMRAGESSGNMDSTALKMSDYFDKEKRLKAKVKSATAYPMILLIMTVVVLIAIFVFILPSFFSMFDSMDSLPLPTRIILGISNGLIGNWPLVLLIVLSIAALFFYLLKIPSVKIFFDKTKLKIPAIGKPLKIIYTARFSRTLSSLYASGLPMIAAIQSSMATIGNKYIISQFDGVIRKIRNGETLSAALKGVDGFEPKLSATINIGEETGKLDSMLNSTAESYEFDADEALERLVNILQPVLIVFLAAIIGFVMISVLMPILSMYQNFSAY